jgi:lysophospholipase L1-like esterase
MKTPNEKLPFLGTGTIGYLVAHRQTVVTTQLPAPRHRRALKRTCISCRLPGMRWRLTVALCAAVAAAAFLFGYEVRKWRYPPFALDLYVVRKEAIRQKVLQNFFYDYVVIGDSITEYAYLPSLCGKAVLNAGISGAVVQDAAGLMADLAPILSANTIILAVGINDAFKTRKRSDTIAADFERLVRLAKSTGAEVFAATLAPVDSTKPDGAARDKGTIASINALIKASVEHDHVITMDSSLKSDDTRDGVHLTEAGTQHWRGTIEAAVCPAWHSAHAIPLGSRTLR